MWPSQKNVIRLQSETKQTADNGAIFEETDYLSGDGMQTAIFGPPFWFTIHLVSFNYPVNPANCDKERYKKWLQATGRILPCRYCRDNFEQNFSDTIRSMQKLYGIEECDKDFYLDNRDMFSRFCYHLHDTVNQMLQKQTPMSFETLRERYEMMRSRCLTAEEEMVARAQGEAGCTQPLHAAQKGKCVISIVPRNEEHEGLTISEKCQIQRTKK